MHDQDQKEFAAVLGAVYEYHGKELTQSVAKLWWAKLRGRVDLATFKAAMDRNLDTGRFLPKIADLLEEVSKFPAPEEAWNMAPKSEYDGGWVFDELMVALGACQDSLDRGDMVGARMAFLERYRAEVQGKVGEPRWWLTRPIGQTEVEKTAWEESAKLTAPASAQTAQLHLAKMRELMRSGSSATALPSQLASEISERLNLERRISSPSSGNEARAE